MDWKNLLRSSTTYLTPRSKGEVMNDVPEEGPNQVPAQIPPPNGFTKGMRRVMAVICATLFTGLILGDALGFLVNQVPAFIYGMLFGGSLMMFDSINDFIKKLGGK